MEKDKNQADLLHSKVHIYVSSYIFMYIWNIANDKAKQVLSAWDKLGLHHPELPEEQMKN